MTSATLAGGGIQHEEPLRTPVTSPGVDPGLSVNTATLSGNRITRCVRINYTVLVTVARLTSTSHEVEETRLALITLETLNSRLTGALTGRVTLN